MHRLPVALARIVFVVIIGAIATALGTLLALGGTRTGRSLLAGVVTARSAALVRGSVSIGRIEGNFYSWLAFDSVVVRDTTGYPLATLGRLELRFQLANLLARRLVFDSVTIIRPRMLLVKHRDGRLNFEEVLRLGENKGSGGPGSLFDLHSVTISDGILTVRTPWSVPGHLRGTASGDSALAAQRLTPGRRIEEGNGHEGLQQVRTIEGLSARFSRIRISTPEHDPLLLRVDSLAFALNDPLIEVRDLVGELRQTSDTLWFDLRRAELPGTRGSARGRIFWPADTLLFDFSFNAGHVALADLRFVSPDFPDFTGSGRLTALSINRDLTEYRIPELDVGNATQRVRGRLTALSHRYKGLGFRGLDLDLRNLDLDVVRPYLDTIPFRGQLSGRIQADGYFDDMRVNADWSFFDDRIEGTPSNLIRMHGPVALGGSDGMIFRQVTVDSADLDLPTVQLAVPAIILPGRARGSGTLDGPWKDVTFTGHLSYQDGNRPQTVARGRIRTNTRNPIVALDADLELSPLDFEGVRRAFPTLTALGGVTGPVHLEGPLDRMRVRADLAGRLGKVKAEGIVTALPPRWGADSLRLEFQDLDLNAARGHGPVTQLAGRAVLSGTVDSMVAPAGRFDLSLGPGWIREFALDTLDAVIGIRDSVLTVEKGQLGFPGGRAEASGTLGWVRPKDGHLTLRVRADSLVAFDSLVTLFMNPAPDSLEERERLEGTMDVRVDLSGAIDSLAMTGEGGLSQVHWNGYRVPSVTGRLTWGGGPRPAVQIEAAVDTVTRGGFNLRGLGLTARGFSDSLHWAAKGLGGELVQARGEGDFRRGAARVLRFDTLEVTLRGNEWTSESPFEITLADSAWGFTETTVTRRDGSARIEVSGALPAHEEGQLDVRVAGVDLRDIYALMQRDTGLVAGTVLVDTRIAGTAADPVFRGTGTLTGPVFGEFRAPLTRVVFNYHRQRFEGDLTFWRTGTALMEISAALPLDLAWSRPTRASRQLPGALGIRIKADSMNLAVMEAFTRNLRQIRGTLLADVTVQGSWEAPRLGGTVEVRNGRAMVPALGVRYGPQNGHVTLSGDSIVVDSMEVRGKQGVLNATGVVRLERLTTPVLDVKLRARDFLVMDVPDYLTLQTDGTVELHGPLLRPTMTGQATARNSVLYFADLVSKSIVNLEDPLFADLVDTASIRRRGLGATLQNRFLDSLTIHDFTFRAAEGVWLRSNEANIQLQGSATVQKARNLYRFDGVFTALRGTYNLKLLAITRAFDVTRGQVTYRGEPDLNADLDIDARHVIRPADAEATAKDVEVTAHIGGTLREPKLTLASSIRPPLSQSDIISLLVLRRTVNSGVVTQGQAQQVAQIASLLASSLTSAIENRLVSDPGAGPDMIEIRPGENLGGQAGRSSLTRLSAGWQLGSKWFVSLNAGFCPLFQQFDYRNFGASLDYHLSSYTTLSANAEPIQTCVSGSAGVSSKRYQMGGDLKWSREY